MKNRVLPLNDSQRELVEYYMVHGGENKLKLCIEKTLHRRISEIEFEDYISIAYEGLIKAARRYSDDRQMKFSTFAFMNVTSSIKTYLTYKNRHKRIANENIQSLSDVNSVGMSLEDTLIGKEDVEIEEDRTEKYMKTLPSDAKKVLKLRMEGYSDKEISQKLSFTKAYISQLLKIMRDYDRVKILRRR